MEVSLVERPVRPSPIRLVDTLVCADCRFAQLFALQPRAICTHPWAEQRNTVIPAAQPACDRSAPRDDDAIALHSYVRAPLSY